MEISGKAIALTGTASGIGLALLEELAQVPCQVLTVDMNTSAPEAACSCLAVQAAQIIPFVCDLASRTGVDTLFEQALLLLGRIDIANPGFAYYEEIANPNWES